MYLLELTFHCAAVAVVVAAVDDDGGDDGDGHLWNRAKSEPFH